MGTLCAAVRQDRWLFFTAVAVCAIGLAAVPDAFIDFRYDRAALVSGQWWRAVTGHLLHLNVAHLLLNLAGLLLICELLWHRLPLLHGFALLLFSAVGTSALLCWQHPELSWYAGLSGALHGLWAGCALAGWWPLQVGGKRSMDGTIPAIGGVPSIRGASSRYFLMGALALLALKLILEAWFGASRYTEEMIGAPVISAAHRYGAFAGTAYVLMWHMSGIWFRK